MPSGRPLGKRNGRLKDWHPVDLASETLNALVTRTGIDPGIVDDVVMGCVMQVGEQGVNIARNAVLAAGWPETVPGTTVDRQCGSSQQAAHFAAQGVIAGAYDVVVAAGVEVMSRVPMGASMVDGKYGFPFGPKVGARYESVGGLVPQGISAEMIADKWGLTREELDAFGLRSQQYAARAADEGRFEREILPVLDAEGRLMTVDEGIRESTHREAGQPQAVVQGGRQGDGGQQLADHRRLGRPPHHERGEGQPARPAAPRPFRASSPWPPTIRGSCSPPRSPPPRRCCSGRA